MNGGIAYTGGLADSRPINSIAFFTCDNGYTLTGGVRFRVCQNDGTWDGTTPTCQGEFSFNFFNTVKPPTIIIATCPDLTALTNGMIGYDIGITGPRPMGTMATYTCNTGYIVNRDSVRVCQNDRTWNGSTPTCQGEDK